MSIDKPFSIKIRLFENYYVPKWAKPVAYISLVAVLTLTIIILATKKCDVASQNSEEEFRSGGSSSADSERPHPNVRKLEPYYNAIISKGGSNNNDGLPNRPIKTIKSDPRPVDDDPVENDRTILGTDLTEQDLKRLIEAVSKSRGRPNRIQAGSDRLTTTVTSTRRASSTTQSYRTAFTNDDYHTQTSDIGHDSTTEKSTQSYLEAIVKNWPSTKFGDIHAESTTTTSRSEETVKYVYPQNGGPTPGPTSESDESELTGPRQLEPYINAILRNEPQILEDIKEHAATEESSDGASEDDVEEMSDEMKEYVEALLKNRPRMRVTGRGDIPLPPMPTNKPPTTTEKNEKNSSKNEKPVVRPPRVRIRLSRPTGTKIAPNGTKIEEVSDDVSTPEESSFDKTEFGACSVRIHNWQTWNGGMNGRLKVHLKEEPSMPTWSAFLVLDSDVTDFVSYDGEVSTSEGKTFKISPKQWNGECKEGQERHIGFQFKWPQDSGEPKLVALTVNGIPYTCDATFEGAEAVEAEIDEPPREESPTSSTTRKPQTTRPQIKPTQKPKPKPPPSKPVEKPELPANTNSERGVFVPWPKKVLGLYVLLADDDHEGYESTAVWEPRLHEWQQKAANVLFFTFIHPITMDVPPAFEALAKTRGQDIPGAIPKDTVVLFALGGYAYSSKIKPWPWLESKEAAEAMAERVAEWPEKYNIDGIDLDLEDGAGDTPKAGPNMIHFVRRLRQLQPKMIIGQPTYGYPQVKAEIAVINASWKNGQNTGLADSVGLMVYQGTQALNYVKNYAQASKQWEGFPIQTDVPKNCILLGAKGATSASTIRTLASETMKNDYLGIMVWYASVKNGLQYAVNWDASDAPATIEAYIEVGQKFKNVK